VTTAFFDKTLAELESDCQSIGVPLIHARSLFRSAYKEGISTPWTEPGLPKSLSTHIANEYGPLDLTIGRELLSSYDGSAKFVIQLGDGRQVEMVLMPEAKRITLCVSSQVGCAQACTFCHTGRMGLVRNLNAAEIVGQVWTANRWIKDHPEWLEKNRLPVHQRVSNIVFMGMGEPLDNVDAVARSITILTNPYGACIAMRRISVSTAGHLDGLDALLKIHPDVRLAISVHSADVAERSKIMPINRKWPLPILIEKLRNLPIQQEHGLLLQYTLIHGVNDSVQHAEKLIALVQGLNVKINLIPLNPVGPSRFQSPELERLEAFRDTVYRSGIRVMVRYSKGQDIAAACGQLVVPQLQETV
jgi:23S rRNA (adenine2503-C2)-methyltransferase